MGKVWMTSDLHFNHQKDFIYAARGFENVYDMNRALIERWNKVVAPDDDVYVLGDLCLGDLEEGRKCLSQLKGNIYIVRGNHDTDNRVAMYRELWNVKEVYEGKFLHYNGYHFYLSHFPTLTSNMDSDKSLKKRTLSLCGHSHTKNKFSDMDKGLIYHVELDCSNNAPVSLDKIIEDFEYFYALPIEQKKKIVSMEIYNEKN